MAELLNNNQKESEKIEAEKDAAFRAEIQGIKNEKQDPHFDESFNVEALTSFDEEVWQKIKNEEFNNAQEFKAYQARAIKEIEELQTTDPDRAKTRNNFWAFLANKATLSIITKQYGKS